MTSSPDAHNSANPLYAVLHTSRLQEGLPAVATAITVLRQSRTLNAPQGLRGVLAFDGERFAQLLVGPQAAVLQRLADIAADPRHVNLCVFFDGPLSTPLSGVGCWLTGWIPPETLALLDAPEVGPGPQALQTFIDLLPAFDLA